MTSPLKPWEYNLNSMPSLGYTFNSASAGRPPVPPRPILRKSNVPTQRVYRPNSGTPFSNVPISGVGYNGYGGFGNYGGYGGFGFYGNNVAQSSFIQLAEENVRPTFQSIENIVRAFSSMAMMLDSTYFAITNTFRAILAVVENFGRLRTMFGQIWANMAIFRLLHRLKERIFDLFRRKSTLESAKEAWITASAGSVAGAASAQNVSGWPLLLFVGIIVSTLFLIEKYLRPRVEKKKEELAAPEGTQAEALYDFQGTGPDELSVRKQDTVTIISQGVQEDMNMVKAGWVYATCNGKSGIVPLNHLQAKTTSNKTEKTEAATQEDKAILTSAPKKEASAVFDNVLPKLSASSGAAKISKEASVEDKVIKDAAPVVKDIVKNPVPQRGASAPTGTIKKTKRALESVAPPAAGTAVAGIASKKGSSVSDTGNNPSQDESG